MMSFIEHVKKSHSLPDVCCPRHGFEIDENEARALYKYLQKEFITREPYEEYELIMRVINGLSNFIDGQ